jgi:hypothetical protein
LPTVAEAKVNTADFTETALFKYGQEQFAMFVGTECTVNLHKVIPMNL